MNRNRYRFWSERLYRRSIQAIGSQLYIDTDRDVGKSILVAGTARSGTTWLADLIAAQISCRTLFEPFNPDLTPEYGGYHYFQYMRPDQQDKVLYSFARKVFTGEIRNRWIDRKNEVLFPKFRLIKEIRANLLLAWLHFNFPEVPFLFIIRHPCAVVLSRVELGWATDKDIEPFLSQPDLINDYLSEYQDLIMRAESIEEKHAIVWCVSNLVPLKQFQSNGMRITYYEDLCNKPEEELSKAFEHINQKDLSLGIIQPDKPSPTTKVTSAVVTGKDKISRWKKALSSSQITKILSIVDEFGLGHLYGDSLTPNKRMP